MLPLDRNSLFRHLPFCQQQPGRYPSSRDCVGGSGPAYWGPTRGVRKASSSSSAWGTACTGGRVNGTINPRLYQPPRPSRARSRKFLGGFLCCRRLCKSLPSTLPPFPSHFPPSPPHSPPPIPSLPRRLLRWCADLQPVRRCSCDGGSN